MEDYNELIQGLLSSVPSDSVPMPDTLSYYILEKERKYYIDSDITENIITLQRMLLRWNMEDKGKPVEERKPIWVYIMSYGGEADYMWMLIDAIKMSKTPVYTVNIGVAASAAAIIFIAGHKRFMMPNAHVLIHEGSAQMSGDAVKVMDATDAYRKELKRMRDFILEHTEIPKTSMSKKRNNDWTLDSEYCLANKVCDVLVESFDDII